MATGNGIKIDIGQCGIWENPNLPGRPVSIDFSRNEIPNVIPSKNFVLVDGLIIFNYLRTHHQEAFEKFLQPYARTMLDAFRRTR